jgi:hypothetical protein
MLRMSEQETVEFARAQEAERVEAMRAELRADG